MNQSWIRNVTLSVFIIIGLSLISIRGVAVQAADTFSPNEISAEDVVVKPIVTRKVAPKYPDEARKRHIQGFVVLSVLVDESGKIANIKTLRSTNDYLTKAAYLAVTPWQFKAGTIKGKPRKMEFKVTLAFHLDKAKGQTRMKTPDKTQPKKPEK